MFNALDLMENKVFLEKLKFGIGDGNLQYYLYNWKCPSMDPDKVSSMICLNNQLLVSTLQSLLLRPNNETASAACTVTLRDQCLGFSGI